MKLEAFLWLSGVCSLSLWAEDQNTALKLPKPELPAQFIKEYNNTVESGALEEALKVINFAASISTVLIVPNDKKKNAEINQPSKSSLDIISE